MLFKLSNRAEVDGLGLLDFSYIFTPYLSHNLVCGSPWDHCQCYLSIMMRIPLILWVLLHCLLCSVIALLLLLFCLKISSAKPAEKTGWLLFYVCVYLCCQISRHGKLFAEKSRIYHIQTDGFITDGLISMKGVGTARLCTSSPGLRWPLPKETGNRWLYESPCPNCLL